jgi:hypothetical protein
LSTLHKKRDGESPSLFFAPVKITAGHFHMLGTILIVVGAVSLLMAFRFSVLLKNGGNFFSEKNAQNDRRQNRTEIPAGLKQAGRCSDHVGGARAGTCLTAIGAVLLTFFFLQAPMIGKGLILSVLGVSGQGRHQNTHARHKQHNQSACLNGQMHFILKIARKAENREAVY